MEKEVVWIDGRDPRLGLCGCAGGEAYCRFSAEEREALKKVNPDEAYLSTNPAGVMLRFFTDSSIVAVRGKVERPSDMTHMPASGQSGFDLYVRDSRVGGYAFRGNVRPAAGSVDFEGEFPSFAESTGKSCLLYLPLYNGVERLEVGLQAGSECASEKFKGGKIAVYGTSIAQGGCVSRPGMLFTSILSRALEKEVLNYGFSGSAFAEREISEIIAKRDVALLVVDVEANAGVDERMENNLPAFLDCYFAVRPDVPVILVSRNPFAMDLYDEDRIKLHLYYRRWLPRLAARFARAGRKVVFADGSSFFRGNFTEYTVDGVHPNDYGSVALAAAYCRRIKKVLAL